MARLLLIAALLCGCSEESTHGFPIMPGGGGQGSVGVVDAGVESGDGMPSQLSGRVCLLNDARQPGSCAGSGADGFTVTLGSQTATTAADGSFTMTRPTGTGLIWNVTGTGIEPSAMRLSSGTTIPAIQSLLYGDMIASMTAVVSVDTGAIIARLRKTNAAITDAVVIASPAPDSETYYDGLDVTSWELDATGGFGVVWISAIAPGTASLTVDNGSAQNTVGGIPVFAGAITFELAEIP
jgi:hypothetical protein